MTALRYPDNDPKTLSKLMATAPLVREREGFWRSLYRATLSSFGSNPLRGFAGSRFNRYRKGN